MQWKMKHVIIYFMITIVTWLRVENKRKCYSRTNKKTSVIGIHVNFHKRQHYLTFILAHKGSLKRNGLFNNEDLQIAKKKFLLFGRDHRNPYLSFEYLNKIIENKKYEVKKLLEEHCDENSPLQIRLKYLQHTMNNKLSESIKRKSEDEKHRLSVIADLKRKTFLPPIKTGDKNEEVEQKGHTNTDYLHNHPIHENSLLHLKNPGNAYMMLHKIGFDAVLVNTDSLSTDGNIQDLEDIVKISRTINRNHRPAIIFNDIVIHPIQIALAVENKADGVLLNFSILRDDVEEMLHYCVNMGTEAIVEVHDYNEIYYATKYGACILMINEYDLLNNTYELNHAIKAINYTIPEIITIAKIDINDKNNINYIEQLGSLCYDSICLENKLKDNDLSQFISLCKKWEAPNKTLLHLNRNNYLKECLNYGNSVNIDKHKKTMETLQNMYADKNMKNDYSKNLLKKYEKEVLLENEENNSFPKEEKKETVEKNNLRENRLTDEENKIVNNFKKEKQKELLFLNQLRELMKEVDDHCQQNASNDMNDNDNEENVKKEERLESLLENFTNIDKSFLKNFFSDDEILNIENSIKNVIDEKKKKSSENNSHKEMKNGTENNNTLGNIDIDSFKDEYFTYEKKNIDDSDIAKKLFDDDTSQEGPSRGLSSE